MTDEIKWLEANNFDAGWVDDRAAVEAVVDTLAYKTFGDTPAGRMVLGDIPREVALWRNCANITGQPTLPVMQQGNLGSCVGFGTCRAIEYTNLQEIVAGDPETFKLLSRTVTYAGSRVEIGKGQLGRGDGSIGAWAAKFSTEYGCLDQGIYEGYDLSKYDIPLAREWGLRGIPDKLETYIKQHKITNTTLIGNIDEARKALSQGYGICVCSSQGFTTTRDKSGICYPKGSWAHCMMCSGYTWIGSDLYFFIENSWGEYMGKSNPAPMGANLATFLCKGDTFSRMLGARDSFAFSGLNGFMRRKIVWDF
jgi:hypothetical protein